MLFISIVDPPFSDQFLYKNVYQSLAAYDYRLLYSAQLSKEKDYIIISVELTCGWLQVLLAKRVTENPFDLTKPTKVVH